MGRQPRISRDLRERIPYLRFVEHFTVKEIVRILGIKKTVVYDTLANYRRFGVACNPNGFTHTLGRRRKLDSTDIRLIKSLLKQNPCLYLDELQDELLTRRDVTVSVPTLFRTLRRLHFSHKRISRRALERNDLERSMFMNNIAGLITDPAQLMFVDEAARNKKNPNREFGWSTIGTKCVHSRCFVRGQRFSILPVLTLDGIIAHNIIPGSVTSATFVNFLREHVVSLSNSYNLKVCVLTFPFLNRYHLRTHILAHAVF
jgi:transposase